MRDSALSSNVVALHRYNKMYLDIYVLLHIYDVYFTAHFMNITRCMAKRDEFWGVFAHCTYIDLHTYVADD